MPSVPTARATLSTAHSLLGLALACGLVFALVSTPAPAANPTQPSTLAPASVAAPLELKDAWIRWLPSGLPAGGYVTVVNRADLPLVLVGASSEVYRDIELHHSLSAGGMTRMLRVNRVAVPAHGTLSFADAGYHLMLMQPSQTLSPGDHVPITLHFAGGRSQTIEFEVRKPNATGPSMQNEMPGMAGMKDMKGTPGTPH